MFVRLFFLSMLFFPIFCWTKAFRSKIIFFKESGESTYQGIFLTEGRSAYPYPIKTDGINQMMARRLAIYHAMLKMAKDITLLKPFLEKDFQPHIDGSFVKNTSVCSYQNLENEVLVFLEYLFICDESQYSKIKKRLKNKIKIEKKRGKFLFSRESKRFLQKKGDHSSRITKDYWEKLVQFYLRMVDDDG